MRKVHPLIILLSPLYRKSMLKNAGVFFEISGGFFLDNESCNAPSLETGVNNIDLKMGPLNFCVSNKDTIPSYKG